MRNLVVAYKTTRNGGTLIRVEKNETKKSIREEMKGNGLRVIEIFTLQQVEKISSDIFHKHHELAQNIKNDGYLNSFK